MKNLLPLLTILFILTSCSQRNNTLFSEIKEFLPHMPDSAFQYLENNRDKIITRKEKATAGLIEYHINNLKEYGFLKDSLLINIMHNNHHYTTNYDQALASYYKGVFLITKQEYEKSIELFHSAEQLANKMKWDHLLGMIYNKSSEVFHELALYNTSIEYADKSIYHFNIANDENLANRALANKIFSLYELRKKEEAQDLYDITKNHALKVGDYHFINDICSELISIMLFYQDIYGAEPFYRDIKSITKGKHILPIEYLYLGNKYTIENQLDSAYYYLSRVNENSLGKYDRTLLKSVLSDYYRQKEDYKKALEYMDQNQTLWASIINDGQRSSLVKVESRSQNLKTRLIYEKKVAERQKVIYWSLVISIILGILLIVIWKRTKKQKEEMNNRIALVSEIVSNLKESNQTLLSKLNIHKEKESRLKEHIESKLTYAKMFADIYYKFPNKPGTILKKMNEMIDLVPENKEFTSGIVNNVNLYYNNAIEKLTQKHTDLTNAEILFSSLIIAGFTIQEMSLILNCNSVDAVYTRKYRLKQKLSINKNIDIEDYLVSFAEENLTS
ncbi:MAG: hypothetical protein LUH10_14845 [Tannerellaceae bacterium]|nr:hypothetical protein [Tannerellaceae bacterium]